MQKFKNKATGRVVEMPEPHEVIEQAEAASEERAKVGSKKAKRDAEIISENGVRQAYHAERILKVMNAENRRWERVADSVEVTEPSAGGQAEGGSTDAGSGDKTEANAGRSTGSKGSGRAKTSG